MTLGIASPTPILQFFDNTGAPAVGGSLLTTVGGVNTATYQDQGLTIPLPNPTPLNSRGEVSNATGTSCQMFLTPGVVYTFTLFDANGNQLDQALTVTQAGPPTAASIGQLIYPQTAAELAATVTPTNYQYMPGDVRRYGAVVDGVTDDSAAVAQSVAQNYNSGNAIYFPAGICVCQLVIVNGGTGIVIRGEGATKSTLLANSTTADVITNQAGTTLVDCVIESLSITAQPSSLGGSGIHWASMSAKPSNIVYRDLEISGFGRSGIWDQVGAFTSYLENVIIGSTINHNLDMAGGNTDTLRNCYMLGTVPILLLFTGNLNAAATSGTLQSAWAYQSGTYTMLTPAGDTVAITLIQNSTAATFGALNFNTGTGTFLGTAGYRIHAGSPTLIGCNGVNQGNIWGMYSDNSAEDATTGYCNPLHIGCNIESFARIGVRNKQTNGCSFLSTTILAHTNGVVGLQVEPNVTGAPSTLDVDGLASSTTSIALVFTAGPTGSTGGTLISVWLYQTGTWPVTLSTGQIINMGLSFNSTTVTWTTAVTGTPTVNATTSSFKFGYPCHTAKITGLPFLQVLGPSGAGQFTYYDDTVPGTAAMTTVAKQIALSTARFAANYFDLNINGMLNSQYAGSATFAAATTVTVTFATPLPTGMTYFVLLGGNAAGYVWPSAQTVNGFTINCSASNSNTTAWAVLVS